jgi:hypothetical protein
LDHQTLAYDKFNVLIWLRRADPDCPLVKSAIEVIQTAYPSFGEPEYPEFDSWHGRAGFVDPTEGFDFDRILLEQPEQFVKEFLQANDGNTRRNLWSFHRCLPTLFKRDKEWGKGFVETLARKSVTGEEIWIGVFQGWRDALDTNEDWQWIIGVIEQLPHESAIYAGIANLLTHGFEKRRDDWDEDTIDRAASLLDRAWNLCKSEKTTPDDNYGDWLTTAINHVGGWIGEFWVHYCSHLRQRAGDNWQGIPPSLQSMMVEALCGTNRVKIHARIALTQWIGYLFAWDRDFAVEHLVPLLDWRRDPVVAQQSWSVLLNYKQGTSKELETQLLPFYRQCAEQIAPMLKDATEKSEQFDEDSLSGHLVSHVMWARRFSFWAGVLEVGSNGEA